MRVTKNVGRQSSLLNSKIRKAAFVPLETQDTKRFKYQLYHNIINRFEDIGTILKRIKTYLWQRLQLWLSKADLVTLRKDLTVWLIEVLVEGATANFATHYLFGIPYTPQTIVAHGIIIKQGLDIYWRMRPNGTNKKIFNKN